MQSDYLIGLFDMLADFAEIIKNQEVKR